MDRKTAFTYFKLFLLGMLLSAHGIAQSQHALIIGIGEYIKIDELKDSRPICRKSGIKDLQCAPNDLATIHTLLTANYGFLEEQIEVIRNKMATRKNILDALDRALNETAPGDLFVFYYSGHGSMRSNVMSPEKDLMNETLVPADGIYQGADIQDKELALRFQQFVEKGILLTVIIDSCHSGSIARGVDVEVKSVDEPQFEEKAMDATTDEFNDPFIYVNPAAGGALVMSAAQDYQQAQGMRYPDGKFYSTFTKTLVEVLKGSDAETTAEQVYDATMSKMRYAGIAQIPVLEGNETRRNASLFGKAIPIQKTRYPVIKFTPSKTIVVEVGAANGVEPGSILANAEMGVKLEVISAAGFTQSLCKVVNGSSTLVKVGSLFEVEKYGFSGKVKSLNVYFPEVNYSLDSLLILNSELPLNNTLPVYHELADLVREQFSDEFESVRISSKEEADYCLYGTLQNGKLGYQLVRNLPYPDPTDPYPPKSEVWYTQPSTQGDVARRISEAAFKLSRTKGWLTLESSPGIPYKLAIQRNNEKELMRGGDVVDKDQVHIFLEKVAEKDDTRNYIYVFGISSDGSIKLIFPLNGANVENYLPIRESDDLIEICTPSISAPFGTDHLVMLATSQPLINPQLIEQTGVATKSANAGSLDRLVAGINSNSRAVTEVDPSLRFYIDRISVTSHEK